ncbi:MAG: hypothetical protein IKR33_05240 [Bacteroidales bacterium]|nr:hypothetical protein [Bacteroidales bacterium]
MTVIAVPNPVIKKIHEYYFLELLLKEFPFMLNGWREKIMKTIKEDVQLASDGDDLIEKNMYSQYSNSIYEQTDFEENLFSQAIFMMVFSYYETILHKMAIDNEVQDRPSAICQKKGVLLSDKATNAAVTIFSEARILRNYLCHNSAGTESENDTEETCKILATLSERGMINMNIERDENGEMVIGKSQLYGVSAEYTLDILNKEYLVLKELAAICGYSRHTSVG